MVKTSGVFHIADSGIRQATKHSMVIIDELGRGTSTTEGLGIALSICEALVKEESRVFFATHFTEIGKDGIKIFQDGANSIAARVLNVTHRSRVLNVHIAGGTIERGAPTQISLPHTVAPGPVRNEDYGLDLAQRFLPVRVVNNAENACKFLRQRHSSRAAGPATQAGKQNKLILALPGLLKQAYASTMDDSALASYLKKLQTEFTIRMDTTEDEAVLGTLPSGDTNQHTVVPVLERPSNEEIEEWRQKCNVAEIRVMHTNMAQDESRNPTASLPDGGAMYSLKSSDYNSVLGDHARGELSSPLTPVNRSSILDKIQQQMLKTTCTPATTWAATPSSMTSEGSDSRAQSVVNNSSDFSSTIGEAVPGHIISSIEGIDHDQLPQGGGGVNECLESESDCGSESIDLLDPDGWEEVMEGVEGGSDSRVKD